MKNNCPLFEIYYCYIDKNFKTNEFYDFVEAFPDSIKAKFKKFRRWQDAQLFLLGRCLILKNILVNDINKLQFLETNKFGKPFITDYPFFNISHSDEIVILIKSDYSRVGIDIEKMKDISVDDFKKQFTEKELIFIKNSTNPTDAFYSLWTQKEAVIKCCGKGLSIPLNSFEICDNLTILNNKDTFYTKKLLIDNRYACHFAHCYQNSDISVRIEQQALYDMPIKKIYN